MRSVVLSWLEVKKTEMEMGFDGFLFLSIDVLVSGHDLDWSDLFFCLFFFVLFIAPLIVLYTYMT